MLAVEKNVDFKFKRIFNDIQNIIVGDGRAAFLLLTALLARGHVLIEDIPGVGKTLLAHSLARATNLGFSRIQCTPDILPSDVVGFSMVDIHSGQTKYIQGSVMSNIVLVDEINRASPKTQSSLLEVMEENQVTIDGVTHLVPQPFMVVATQNPIESVGTSPLPEAQLDRFMMRVSLGYPTNEQEIGMLDRFQSGSPLSDLRPNLETDELRHMQREVDQIEVSPAVKKYIVSLSNATRRQPGVRLGVSPRASLALMHAAMAFAYLRARSFVTPDDVKSLAAPVLAHRLILETRTFGREAAAAGHAIIEEVLSKIAVPLV